ncbi:M12 family metallo-peptidase [Saprospiraceae bacterium]|nr:M12 family metallo-peptidase [Saprospiraceae bacterium]
MKSLVTTFCLCLSFLSNLASQTTESALQLIDESIIINSQSNIERVITPDNYTTLLLDTERLEQIVSSVPKEKNAGSEISEAFEVPLPNGKVELFHLVEYSMMEPALSAKHPSIKTYYGYGTTDRSHRIRLDWTTSGLNAMMQLPEGLAFLKPYSSSDTEHYLSYYERDLPTNTEPFHCGTQDEKMNDQEDLNKSSFAGDCQLRTYRLAIAVTGEYATSTLGASSAGNAADEAIVTSHIVTSINQINGWYERDVTARFILIANLSDIFYYDGATDPYTNGDAIAMLAENISNLDATLGSANFDLGHVLGNAGGSGGVAGLNVLCGASKARGVTRASSGGITQPRFLKVWSHEMGHQFGAGHTQNENCQRSAASAMEPGAGTTLMSYVTSNCANQIQGTPDYYFHAISIQQMSARMLGTSCAAILPSANTAPTVSAGPDVSVPSSTPLLLEAVANDIDGDPLTFTWEQFNNDVADAIPPQSTNLLGPNFRSFPPSADSKRYLPNLPAVIDGTTPTWEVLPSVARTMDFRVTVRDNSTNSMSCTAEDDIEITTVAGSPFLVTSPTTSGVIWVEGQPHTVTWDVAGTDVAPVSCDNVDILLSYDGGLTYPVTLATSVANNGTATVNVPTGVTTTARVQVRASDNIFYNISAENFEIEVSSGPTFSLNLPNPLSTICPGDVESNIPLTTTVFSGFSGNVTLSASNLPGSSTITFDSQIIAAGTATSFEINNTAGLAEGNYTITISGVSGAINRDVNYVLTVEEAAGTTTLDLPVDNATDIGIIPSLSWILKSNANSYDIQVSEDASFAILDVDETVNTNFYSPDMSLQALTLYHWRVRAATDCGDTPWSMVREFTTEDCAASFIQNTPVPISASGTPVVTSVMTVTGSGTVQDLEVSNVFGTHTWIEDLTVELIAPGGSPVVVLWTGECGDSDDFNLSFSDDATVPVGSAPCNPLGQGGTFIPEQALSAFNGLPIAGDWTLRVSDGVNQDGGQLNSWRLDFCSSIPEVPKDYIFYTGNSSSLVGQIGFDCEIDTSFSISQTQIRDIVIDPSDNTLYLTSGGANRIVKMNFDGTNLQPIFSNPNGEIGDLAQLDSFLFYSTNDGTIGKVKKDGTNASVLNTNTGDASGIAIDSKNEHVYWTNISNGTISRADLDGLNESVVLNVISPIRLAVDTIAEKIYWIEQGASNVIKRANFDGSTVETIITLNTFGTGIELDMINSKVYWSQGNTSIRRANLDGSFIEIFSDSYPGGGGIAISISNVKPASINNVFKGIKSEAWNNPFNWQECQTPAYQVSGSIIIDANCMTDQEIPVQANGSIQINGNYTLEVKE